jgi:carbon storage regulator
MSKNIESKSGHLILTRRVSETVVLNDNITINVLGIRGSQVRFGITAPKEIPVHRKEIYDKIKAQSETKR